MSTKATEKFSADRPLHRTDGMQLQQLDEGDKARRVQEIVERCGERQTPAVTKPMDQRRVVLCPIIKAEDIMEIILRKSPEQWASQVGQLLDKGKLFPAKRDQAILLLVRQKDEILASLKESQKKAEARVQLAECLQILLEGDFSSTEVLREAVAGHSDLLEALVKLPNVSEKALAGVVQGAVSAHDDSVVTALLAEHSVSTETRLFFVRECILHLVFDLNIFSHLLRGQKIGQTDKEALIQSLERIFSLIPVCTEMMQIDAILDWMKKDL